MYAIEMQPPRSKSLMYTAVLMLTLFAALSICVAVLNLDFRWFVAFALVIVAPTAYWMAPNRRQVIIALMLFAVPINFDENVLLHPSTGGADGITLGLADIMMIVLAALTLFRATRVRESGRLRFFPLIMLPSLALFLAAVISTLSSRDLLWSSFDLLNMAKTLLFFWLLANNIVDERDLNIVIISMFLGVLIQTALAAILNYNPELAHYFLKIKLGVAPGGQAIDDVRNEFYRSGGTLGSANHLGRYLGLVLPIALAITVTHRRPLMSRFSSLTAVVGTFAIFQTLTRSAWVGLFFSLVIMVFLMFHHRLITFRAIFKLGTMALAMIAIIIALWQPIEKRLFGDDNGSSYTRITTAKVALRIIRDYPLFGCGINNYGAVLPDYWIAEDVFTREAAVHNNYLLYAAEIGLIGFAAYLWLLIAAASSILRAIRSRNTYFAAVAVGIMAAFGAYLLEALSDKSYKENYTLLLSFWGLLAITEAMNRLSINSQKGIHNVRGALVG